MTRCTSLALLLLTACAVGEAAQQGAIRDSAGIRIIQNPEVAPDTASWSIGTTPRLLIGDDAKGAQYVFGFVVDVARTVSGRIAVADRNALQISLYDSSGSFIRTLGRRGQGPGEFTRLYRLFLLRGDTIAATTEIAGGPSTFFPPHGDGVPTAKPLPFTADVGGRTYASPHHLAFFGDGYALAAASLRQSSRGEPGPDRRKPIVIVDSARILRLGSGGQAVADYGDWVMGRSLRYAAPTPRDPRGDGYSFPRAEFFPQPAWAARGTEMYASFGDPFEIRVYDANARLRRIIRKSHSPRSIPQAWRDSLWGRLTSEPRLAWLRLAEAEPPPIAMSPATDRILIDHLGNLWVRSTPVGRPEPATWFVFDTTGVLRHSLRTSHDIRQIDPDRVVAIVRDSLYVQRVGVFDLRKRR